jgi:hypothetical protein
MVDFLKILDGGEKAGEKAVCHTVGACFLNVPMTAVKI